VTAWMRTEPSFNFVSCSKIEARVDLVGNHPGFGFLCGGGQQQRRGGFRGSQFFPQYDDVRRGFNP